MEVNGIKLVAALQASFDSLLADIDNAGTYDEARMKGAECAGFFDAVGTLSDATRSEDDAASTSGLDFVVMQWIRAAAQHMEDAAHRTDATDIELANICRLREWLETEENRTKGDKIL